MRQKKKIKISLETLDARFNTVDGRLDTIDTRLDTFDVRLSTIDARLDTLDVRLGTLETRVNTLDARVGALEEKVDILNIKVDELDRGQRKLGVLLEEVDAKFKLSLEGYAAVNQRLDILQETIHAMGKLIDEKFEFIIEKLNKKVDRDEFMAFQERILPAN
jgi:chromosome segregation ATPase